MGAVLLAFSPVGWVALAGVYGFVVWLVDLVIVRYKKFRLVKSPVSSRIRVYEDALATYEAAQKAEWKASREAARAQWEIEKARRAAEKERHRKLSEYWVSLGGVEFERELGILFRALGYQVESTPTSGDQGIDLILKKSGQTHVVQCKAHKSGVGPSVARELLGSMVAYGARKAILACTGGFTKGVYEFARGKPIRLISASDIARMAAEVHGSEVRELAESPPVCPVQGCEETMVLRNGRYGGFWGCRRYPQCRGTRRAH